MTQPTIENTSIDFVIIYFSYQLTTLSAIFAFIFCIRTEEIIDQSWSRTSVAATIKIPSAGFDLYRDGDSILILAVRKSLHLMVSVYEKWIKDHVDVFPSPKGRVLQGRIRLWGLFVTGSKRDYRHGDKPFVSAGEYSSLAQDNKIGFRESFGDYSRKMSRSLLKMYFHKMLNFPSKTQT